MKKIIGISSRTLSYENAVKVFVNKRYLDYLDKKNINYIILPLTLNDDVLSLCDGFLITGGYDMDPKYFKQELHPTSILVDREVDEADLKIINYAIKNHKPLLGICRGHQVINVAFNGTLHQDVSNHSMIRHNIITYPSRLIKGLDKYINTNSFHHQTIDKLGDNLVMIGITDDNTIEMIEHESLPIFAVQFHPELEKESALSILILESFKALL